jgi:glucose-1-phosphate adenylyltransferase
VSDSLVSPACVVYGTVRGSVLGPGVVVEAGAAVVDSVLLADTVVRAGASVTRAVLDERTEVGADARVGRPAGGIPVTGRGVAVAAGTELDAEDGQ